MALISDLRRRVALFICPEMAPRKLEPMAQAAFFDLMVAVASIHARRPCIIPVEVQTEPGGPWHPARFVDGVLNWVRGPLDKEAAESLAAIRDAIGGANREARAAIDAALAEASARSADEETQRASQARHAVDPNSAEARMRFRFPQSAQTGGSK